jgi:parvulin-like peptidyl-prolyl isomerase
VESTDVADKVRARLAAGDNFTALATEDSLEPITRGKGGNLGWLPKGFTDILLGSLGNSALKDIPFTLKAGELSEPTFDGMVSKSIGYWVVQVTEKDPKKGSHVRVILTGSRHDAETIREKILAGEDFATLVKTYSQDSASVANGGDLGWTEEGGITNRVVLGMAMPLETGAVSEPGADSTVQTVGGFWLVKAVDRDDNRTVDDNMRQTLRNGLFENWIAEKMKNDSVETLLTDEQKAWAINLVIKSRG